MVNSQTTSITPAHHADRHRHGGADPLTGDVRIDSISGSMISADVEIFASGAVPTAFADLDLSTWVGARECLVVLHLSLGGTRYFTFIPKGDAEVPPSATGGSSSRGGTDGSAVSATYEAIVCKTDASGIIRWCVNAAGVGVIRLDSYMVI